MLEANFTMIWIEGEISNLVVPNSGHLYFSLKDQQAQVRCVMFRNHSLGLSFRPKNGAQVVVLAQVSLYEPRGDYQLMVQQMDPTGAGILHAKFLQLKNKLEAEGLFDSQRKRALPKLPRAIGIITSPTGAAIRDVLSVLRRRFPSIPVIIYPTQVQGVEAAPQIVEALAVANRRNECEVLIVTRGGGSLEDLWPFNEEMVARAIAASKLPVISAVGHEIDFTIADFVADQRAPTPSAAAELVVPDAADWIAKVERLYRNCLSLTQHQLQECQWHLSDLKNRLRHPRDYLRQQVQRLDDLERRLQLAIQQQLKYWQQHLNAISSELDLISPLATLARGYAIALKDGKVLYSSSEVAVGDQIELRLANGTIRCRRDVL